MKAPNIMHGSRNEPWIDGFNLALIDTNSLGRNNVSQEYHLKSKKGALLKTPIEFLLLKNYHNLLEMTEMLLYDLAKNQFIIKIHDHELSKGWLKNLVR